MNSIRAKFLAIVGIFALAFSAFLLYRVWYCTRNRLEAVTAREGALALEFELAVRDYVSQEIRPEMEKRIGPDEFVPAAMSSSYVARHVFERVHERLPDYVIKFAAERPRNPDNLAGPEELRRLEFFRRHPELTRWSGKIQLSGKTYLAHVSPMWTNKSCLRCHGRPEDAPAALVAHYGAQAGFGREVGEIAGLDTVAVPLSTVEEAISTETTWHLAMSGVSLVVLFGSILIAFRVLVGNRLKALTEHFALAAERGDAAPISPLPVRGRDEIGMLAASYNTLAGRLRDLHASLEQRVAARTAQLQDEVAERRHAEAALQAKQQLLRQLLDVYEKHRKLVACEIHDAVMQPLTATLMGLETAREQFNRQQPPIVCQPIEQGVPSLRGVIDTTRRVMSGLGPMILDELGAVSAIDNLVAEARRDGGPDIDLQCDVQFDRLAPPLETAIFRIVQEALANACRHSQSQRVRISLQQQADRLTIEVEDWGIGFDPQAVDADRFGLKGIRERAQLFGGTATIDSQPGKGTRIVVELPLTEAMMADGTAEPT